MQSRRWVFTDFNNEVIFGGKMKYMCYGVEKCPTTDRIHHQGYVSFESNMRFNGLKKLYPTTHFEVARSSEGECIEYCKKDGDFHEFGERSKQGKRTDLEYVQEQIQAGSSLKDIAQNNFAQFVRYGKGIQAYRNLVAIPRNKMPIVKWYWGPSGCGKTRTAIEESKGDFFIWNGTDQWWDGYDGQKFIIIDDIRKGNMSEAFLLKFCDRYPQKLQIKGGFVENQAETIIFTCNYHWHDIFTERDPIQRRIQITKGEWDKGQWDKSE